MSLLFYIDEKGEGAVLRPECYKLCPELSVLKENELLFIILAYDYHSIYRQFPEHDRIRKAMYHAFGDSMMEILEKHTIKNAIIAYKSLQYDPKIDLIDEYQKKINKLRITLQEDDSASGIEKNAKAIDTLRRHINEIQKEVTESVISKGVIKGGQELSLLEELLANQKHYKSVTTLK